MSKLTKTNKTIPCPEFLHAGKQSFVNEISHIDDEYFAFLPYLGNGYKVLISKGIFDQIEKMWREEIVALLEVNDGTIRNSDNVMCPRSINITSEETQL